MKKNPLKNNKFGFTLVEMMVAIAVFSVVMVVASTALLSIIDASRKAQSIKTAINTLNFALDGISKDVRVGIEYQCIDDTGSPQASCVGGGAKWFGYRSPKAYFDTISKKLPSYFREQIKEAIKNQTEFISRTFDFNGYDGSVSFHIDENGDFKGFLNKEYRGCGNGYYYLLINDKYFIGYDVD